MRNAGGAASRATADPWLPTAKLELAELHGTCRGDYRVIYRMDEREHRIDVVPIDHRFDVYQPRRS